MTSIHDKNKEALAPLRDALYAGDRDAARRTLDAAIAPGARLRMNAPFQDIADADDLWRRVYAPLLQAMPDAERRDFIFMAGARSGGDGQGEENWVGIGGNFIGTLAAPWLGIPPTGKPVFMRHHEYLRLEDGRITALEGIWDIPQVMLQAGAWPMTPQLGAEWMCPGPARRDASAAAEDSLRVVREMLDDLRQGDAATPERGLAGFWHPHCAWYGPAGIGSARGFGGVRDVVLRGFRSGLSENVRMLEQGVFFGEGDLVAFTGWPSGSALHSGDGFLGLAATGRRFSRRSLDFWRIEEGLIRENWVMVDLIDIYRQLGVDVFARMHALCPAASGDGVPKDSLPLREAM